MGEFELQETERSLGCVTARSCLPRKLPVPGTFVRVERDAEKGGPPLRAG